MQMLLATPTCCTVMLYSHDLTMNTCARCTRTLPTWGASRPGSAAVRWHQKFQKTQEYAWWVRFSTTVAGVALSQRACSAPVA